ncbi:MAG: hypothetical protein H8D94_00775 [Candidatus Pelagibacter sp.]|nr:hypothetical protein [Candidatus Pelagibacter sp.]
MGKDLTNERISKSFGRLLQISPDDNSTVLDGTGSIATTLILSGSALHLTGSLPTLVVSSSQVNFNGLPIADPTVEGRLWRSGQTVMISTGSGA